MQKSSAFGLFSAYLFISLAFGAFFVAFSARRGFNLIESCKWIIVPMTAHIASLSWPVDYLSPDYSYTGSFQAGPGGLSSAKVEAAFVGFIESLTPVFGSSPVAGAAPLLSIDSRSDVAQPWLLKNDLPILDNLAGDAIELAIIDRGVEGWEHLVDDLRGMQRSGRRLDVVVLDEARDGVRQISEALTGYRELSALHILSHGSAGGLQLGNAGLFDGNLSLYAADLVGWRESLAEGADILIYGCDVASGKRGQTFVDGLAAFTGADVAASSDMTGAASLGGNWGLEFQTGVIDSRLAVTASLREDWQYVLQVNIDQAWLAARGAGPYYLDQQGETYVLQTDVTSSGTAFAIIAKDVVFDLNGNTITYNNGTPITVFNGSFEQGSGASAAGWDFTTAANAERFNGIWLHNEVYDGQYSLRFSDTKTNQHVVSTSTVTLEANTTYSLSAMFEYGGFGNTANPGVKGYVRLRGQNLPVREVNWSQTNWRGIQLKEGEFTTGSSPESYTVEVGIEGNASASAPFYFDNVRLQRTRDYGVVVSPKNWATSTTPGVTRYGNADNAKIQNGTIVQGGDGGTNSHGILVFSSWGVSVEGLDVTVNGANSSAVIGIDNFTKPVVIQGNTFTSNVKTITSRDNFDGAVVLGIVGTFQDNIIRNGPHGGFVTGGNGPSSIVAGNSIQLQARYTNAFAIIATRGSQIFNNVINNGDGQFTSRGIGITSGIDANNPTRVYNNEIHVQQLAQNQEYQGIPIGGAYGIQMEDTSFTEVYGNEVYAYGREAPAYAFRFGPFSSPQTASNNFVHHNLFVATRFGAIGVTTRTGAVKASDNNAAESALLFEDNQIVTNDVIVESDWSTFTLYRTHLQITESTGTAEPFISQYANGSGIHSSISFVDTTFDDLASSSYFDSAIVRSYGTHGSPDDRMAFSSSWSTTFDVRGNQSQPLANASVVVRNTRDEIVFEGVTDQDGRVEAILRQFETTGATKVIDNDHRVTVTLNGVTNESTFTADNPGMVSVDLDIDGNSPYQFEYTGSHLTVHATEGDNEFVWSAADPLRVFIDGLEFGIRPGTASFVFNGAGGHDKISLSGSTGDDEFKIRIAEVELLSGNGLTLFANDFEEVDALGGAGESDRAVLYDSPGSDTFTADQEVASFAGASFRHTVNGFQRVIANSTTVGDIANFHDSAGDDTFLAKPGFASMISGQITTRANGFNRITASSTAGGNDVAGLTGSAEVNVYSAFPTYATLTRYGYEARANGFDSVYGYSGAANNVAWLYDSADKDTLAGNMLAPRIFGTGFSNLAIGFTRVYSVATAGSDKLNMGDSPADDVFTVSPGLATLVGGGILVQATGFVSQVVRSDQGGVDSVYLRATGSSNSVTMFDTFTGMSNGSASWFQRASSFANTHIEITSPGQDNVIYIAAPPVGNAQTMEFDAGWGWSRHADRLRRFSGFNRATVQYREGIDQYWQGNVNYILTMVKV